MEKQTFVISEKTNNITGLKRYKKVSQQNLLMSFMGKDVS